MEGNSRPGTPASQELLAKELLECPVCFELMKPPIFQCNSGHLICNSCATKLKKCPSCRIPLNGVRNRALEKIAETIEYSCMHSTFGCGHVATCAEISSHESACSFRPLPCLLGGNCRWLGALNDFKEHATASHGFTLHKKDATKESFGLDVRIPIAELDKSPSYANFVKYGERHLLLAFFASNDHILSFVCILGESSPGEYQLSATHKEDPSRTYTFAGPCRSVREYDSIRDSGDGLYLSTHVLDMMRKGATSEKLVLKTRVAFERK
eukprot:TRINITY_DN31753_c0_g1_i1.p1 TRINITY_DN31753_c0_g1~~TRINITY_DN31753_c0_g1_i1.p1  ORF type:complete len:268 (-),score=43.13 TRINITY_DN31753_c0_g1_i1:621-1424(-)